MLQLALTLAALQLPPHQIFIAPPAPTQVSQPTAPEPFRFLRNTTPAKPLWLQLVEQLPERDPQTEHYSLSDIAPILNLKTRSLAKHCRALWPTWEGQYRLNHDEAVQLIRRVCAVGRNVKSGDAR